MTAAAPETRDAVKRRRFFRDLVVEGDETIPLALADPAVIEIMLNPDGRVWIDRLAGGVEATEMRIAPNVAHMLISTIAGHLGKYVNEATPVLEGSLPYMLARIEAVVPPVAHPAACFSIRKHVSLSMTLDEHVARGTLSASHAALLRAAVLDRETILVAGGTGSGKTTLVNALVRVIPPTDRILLLESTPELDLQGQHVVPLAADENAGIDLLRLLSVTMRMRPDRIIVGELRGTEARAWLDSLNTGHPGSLATIHADGAADAFERVETLLLQAGVVPVRGQIAKLVKHIVFMRHKRVVEVLRVDGWDERGYRLREISHDV